MVESLLYYFGRFVFLIYLKVLYRLNIEGREHVPERKPFIICANHICWLDPLAVGAALPARYKIHFMGKKELFKNFFFSFILKKAYAFPVNREEADYGAIKKALQLLKNGQVLGLFPEGSRSKNGKIQKAFNGAALIANHSGVPILPVLIVGPYRLFRPVRLHIGEPFALPPLNYEQREQKKEQLGEMSSMIMQNISSLAARNGGE